MEERNNTTVDRLLNVPDKGVSEIPFTEGGILARLYRKMVMEANVSRIRWSDYMEAHMKMVMRGKSDTGPGYLSEKGNMTKMLTRDSFTWKNFIKAMRFLQTKRLRIIIERTDWSGKTYVVEETVEFKTLNTTESEEENDSK